MVKQTPLERFFKTHRSTCAVHIHSGDRHCSCGRDEALQDLVNLSKKWLDFCCEDEVTNDVINECGLELATHLTPYAPRPETGAANADSESNPAVSGG